MAFIFYDTSFEFYFSLTDLLSYNLSQYCPATGPQSVFSGGGAYLGGAA